MEEFRCLESTFGDASVKDWMIISERVITDHTDDTELIVCWLLASYGHRQNAIYRLTADQCNSDVRDRIAAELLRPAATLVEVRRGSLGWFDAITDRLGSNDDNDGEGVTAVSVDDVYTNNDWSFLDGSPVEYVYNEPYVATGSDDDEDDQPDAEWVRENHQRPHNAAITVSLSAAPLSVSVLLASCLYLTATDIP